MTQKIPDPSEFMRVAAALESAGWIYAKTMPKHPHWYTLRDKWDRDVDFERVVQFIRDYGYTEYFYKKPFTRFDINGYKYWSMGAPLEETILINRAQIDGPEIYDDVARFYDDNYEDPKFKQEDQDVIDLLAYEGGRVLDIGCGTGMFLDYVTPDEYIGFDPCHGMIERLSRKHRNAVAMVTKFERFFIDDPADIAISIFGSPSYVDPGYWSRLPHFVRSGGRFFLMFYKIGYKPKLYDKYGMPTAINWRPEMPFPGEWIEFNNYEIYRGAFA